MKRMTLRTFFLMSLAFVMSACSSTIKEGSEELSESVELSESNRYAISTGESMADTNVLSYRIVGNFRFDSNKSELDSKGKEIVDRIANQLKLSNVYSISVIGYTDPMGRDSYNIGLSQKRAESVKARLIRQGITSEISTVALGSQNLVKTCEMTKNKKLLRECLSPNRRVEIMATSR